MAFFFLSLQVVLIGVGQHGVFFEDQGWPFNFSV
jgi:hypothetical protein